MTRREPRHDARTDRKPRRPAPPRLEVLEDRLAPAADFTAAVDPAWFATVAEAKVAAPVAGPVVAGEVHDWVVQFDPQAVAGLGSVAGTATLLSGAGFQAQVIQGLGAVGTVQVRTTGADVATVSAWLSANPDVTSFGADGAIQVSLTPNDPSYPQMYGPQKIDAPAAWDISTGSTKVVVGDIDTGIDYKHQDLYKNVWINQGEIPASVAAAIKANANWDVDGDGLITFWDLNDARNQGAGKITDRDGDGRITAADILRTVSQGGWADGVDTDGNGYKDDFIGWDFVNNDNDPYDDNSHGTHTAGTIGAVGNNATGVTGINWQVSIMPLKFLSGAGSGSTADAIKAINYATMMRQGHGVNIRLTNNSWGGGGYDATLLSAINAGGQAGVLFVAAAGNDGSSSPGYPAGYDSNYIISVAATDSADQLAYFSNRGSSWVDLSAPGVGILSTVPGNGYASYNGTSMATPHVAGVAALAWSVAPGATLAQVRQAIFDGVDPVAALQGQVATGGRLNAYRTVQLLTGDGTPTARDDAAYTPAGQAVQIDVLANDSDINGDALTVTQVQSPTPSGGTVVVNGGKSVTYTPTAGFKGTEQFAYTITDATGKTATAKVTVTVYDVSSGGVVNPSFELPLTTGWTTTGDVTRQDSTVGAAPTHAQYQAFLTTSTAHGGTVTDTTLEQKLGLAAGALDKLIPFNNALYGSALYQTVNVVAGTVLTFDYNFVTNEDEYSSVPDFAFFSVAPAGGTGKGYVLAQVGQVSLQPFPNTEYIYAAGYKGYSYTFTQGGQYKIGFGVIQSVDQYVDSALLVDNLVAVTPGPPNNPPVAADDTAATDEDTPVTIDVLQNDTDADRDPLSISAVGTPGHGTAVVNNGKVVYTPAKDYNGTDTFTYTVSDGKGGTDTGTVTVTVDPVNDNPVAVNDGPVSTPQDKPVTIDVLKNDTDVDGDTLTVTGVTDNPLGTAAVVGNKVVYTPNGATGTNTVTYTVSDGHGGTATATVTITVTRVNRNPVAVNDSAITKEDTAALINVLGNDTDADGDTPTISGVTNGSHGTAKVQNGQVLYTPAANYNGSDSFTYSISDGFGGTATATVTVTIDPVNDNPVAVNDTASTQQGQAVSINVLANDTDVDGDTLSVSAVTNGGKGTAAIQGSQVLYTPAAGQTGTDTFTYTVSDGQGGTATGTVTVTINAPPPPNGVVNGGFESGLTGWQKLGYATTTTTAYGQSPREGQNQALLTTSDYLGGNRSTSEIETFLGLSPYSLSYALYYPTGGSAIKQTITAAAGSKLTFYVNFQTYEQPYNYAFNDASFFAVTGSGLNEVYSLADTESGLAYTSAGTYGSGYLGFEYTFTQSGTFTIGFGVVDGTDYTTDSALLVDAVAIPGGGGGENTADLVAHWALDGNAADTSPEGGNNSGTVSGGATFVSGGKIGGALQLGSNGAYVAVPNSNDINLTAQAKRTVTAWFKVNNASSTAKQVIYEEGGTTRGLNIYVHAGKVYVGGWNTPESGWSGTFLSAPVQSGQWYHVALVLNAAANVKSVQAGAFTAYLNGQSIGSGGGSQVWAHSAGIGIGRMNNQALFHDGAVSGSGAQFYGFLDDVRVYNRALAASEIGQLAGGSTQGAAGIAGFNPAAGAKPSGLTALNGFTGVDFFSLFGSSPGTGSYSFGFGTGGYFGNQGTKAGPVVSPPPPTKPSTSLLDSFFSSWWDGPFGLF